MTTKDGVKWFKQTFQADILAATAGKSYGIDLVTAVACQETGHIWQTLRTKFANVSDILALCVGDTIDDTGGRKAFPRNKAELMAHPKGAAMFTIARKALEDMSKHIPGFKKVVTNPNKFCHGYGLFQYDLQFFKVDPDYFLKKKYETFANTLAKCLHELDSGVTKLNYGAKAKLSDLECAHVAIAYNTGGFKPAKGLKQGYKDKTTGKYYGEYIFDYIQLAKSVTVSGVPVLPPPAGSAIITAPEPVDATGDFLEVDTKISTLRLRSAPEITTPVNKNVVAELPDGQVVRSFGEKAVGGFLRVETSLNGALLGGYASEKFLAKAPAAATIPVAEPTSEPPAGGLPAAHMPRAAGSITRRTDMAGAHSLNEAGQPTRSGSTPAQLTAKLAEIIDWLAVDKDAHKRYKPGSGKTYCNIYTHDYCHLANVYLPRVWWTQGAIVKLTKGEQVLPKYASTIEEMRANDLFRWLRDFGNSFGWQRASSLGEIQAQANQGGLGLIVARRKIEGKSGHIVMVVPETTDHEARRNAAGEVVAALQSQAGASNFRYGASASEWWKGDQFAEFAFWKHA